MEPIQEVAGEFGLETRMPAIDIVEEPDAFVVTAELPGVNKKDIKVDVEDRAVRIRATHEEETKPKGKEQGNFIRRERRMVTYDRYIELPEEVSAEGTRATFRNGVLEVRIPKTSPEKRHAKSVEVE